MPGDNQANSADMGGIGRSIISKIWGSDFITRRAKIRNHFNGAFHDYADEVCFGRVWSRPAIDAKQRSMLTLAMLVALNRPAQLRTHLEGAIVNGCTTEEIQEILLQAAVYCGIPAAGDAFRIAEEILQERKMI